MKRWETSAEKQKIFKKEVNGDSKTEKHNI